MALLNRLFSSRKKQQQSRGYVSPSPDSNRKPFQFSKDQVRILLFRECERRGRKLLFDSKAVKKVLLPNANQSSKVRFGSQSKNDDFKKPSSYVEITNGYGYQYTKPGTDVKSFGEMIFGSVAMALRGPTLKVHSGDTPPVLMFTKVSNPPARRVNDRNLEDSYGSSISSMSDFFSGTSSSDSKLCQVPGSHPLDVPHPSSLTIGLSQFYVSHDTSRSLSGHRLGSLEGDSGCCTGSFGSSGGLLGCGGSNPVSPDSRKSSGGSLSSLRQRWLRAASTSLDIDSSQSLTHSNSIACCVEEKALCRTKLGVALVISLTPSQKEVMREFLLEHGALVESIIVRLHAAVERAYCRKESFVSMMMDASCEVEQSVEDLVLGPRLPTPVWLGLLLVGSCSQPHRSAIATAFLQELSQLLDTQDTKDTNFFMSTLVTAVLTHHLGWVPTVVPYSGRLSELPKLHPYNPLWAQTMDLYGALGHPLKTSRTVVMSTAKNHIDVIEKLLRVLSYFIRCAGIERYDPKLDDINIRSCLNNSAGVIASSATLCAEDRVASSSTLRPISGECTPLRNLNESSTPGNASEISSNIEGNSSFVLDYASSKSDNSFSIIVGKMCDESQTTEPSSKGLRRAVSYASRMSSVSSMNKSSSNHLTKLPSSGATFTPEGIAEKVSRLCRVPTSAILCHLTPPLPQKIDVERQHSAPPAKGVQEDDSERVIFVLGDDENLLDLKSNSKTKEDCSKHHQPLSFSGSEVESGFSECESYELSPVRSMSDAGIGLRSITTDAVNANCNNVEMETHDSTADRMCLRDLTNAMQALPSCGASDQKVVTVRPSVIEVESENAKQNLSNAPVNVLRLRSLARSLSVNLPVCVKTKNVDMDANVPCLKCGALTLTQNLRENISPNFEAKRTSRKKTVRRLCRAHSSFCVMCNMEALTKNSACCKCFNIQRKKSNDFIPLPLKGENSFLNSEHPEIPVPTAQNTDRERVANVVELSVPVFQPGDELQSASGWGIAGSLFGGVSSHYIAERVLQGCAPLSSGWELTLKRDLALNAHCPVLDSGLAEAVAIVANVDTWEVQLMSSHTYVVDRPGTLGVRMGLSQLVANMLEALLHLWKLHASPELCLALLEGRLREIWLRSQALSELLLSTEFCNMDLLTSSLSLEANDVPLLLAVASTHSPEVTQRYGLSFR